MGRGRWVESDGLSQMHSAKWIESKLNLKAQAKVEAPSEAEVSKARRQLRMLKGVSGVF